MSERKILEYDLLGKKYKVAAVITYYLFSSRLMICLDKVNPRTGNSIEPFTVLTANLPGGGLAKNEAFIDHDLMAENLAFIEKYNLGKVIGYQKNGFVKFPKVAFNLDRLRELDPEGMKHYEKYLKATEEKGD